MARADSTWNPVQGYNPKYRDANMVTKYMVSTTGDRWFIPYNDTASTADQLAQCKKVVGYSDNPSTSNPYGLEVVA